jgi:transposase
VVVARQNVSAEADLAVVDLRPDRRFTPRCHRCGGPASRVCSRHVRAVRDLDFASAQVHLRLTYRKVFCPACKAVVVEDMALVDPWKRVTRRLARAIHELCKVMTIADVARHFRLDWKTVKNIDKAFLEETCGETDYEGLRVLAIDEIAVRKGHTYMTVVLDYDTGRVVWMGEGRSKDTLKAFFEGMTEDQRLALEAVAIDMHAPYIQAIEEAAPQAKIVFDLYHVMAAYGRLIDKVRRSEYRKATAEQKEVFKGARYLLLKRRLKRRKEREHLKALLKLNETLAHVYILRDMLRKIWAYRQRLWAARALIEWCRLARAVGHPELDRFAATLERHREGILSHCDYPIHTSRLEGVNNKIKVIKRNAYGYHDDRYFVLKIKQAFDPESKSLFRR